MNLMRKKKLSINHKSYLKSKKVLLFLKKLYEKEASLLVYWVSTTSAVIS